MNCGCLSLFKERTMLFSSLSSFSSPFSSPLLFSPSLLLIHINERNKAGKERSQEKKIHTRWQWCWLLFVVVVRWTTWNCWNIWDVGVYSPQFHSHLVREKQTTKGNPTMRCEDKWTTNRIKENVNPKLPLSRERSNMRWPETVWWQQQESPVFLLLFIWPRVLIDGSPPTYSTDLKMTIS